MATALALVLGVAGVTSAQANGPVIHNVPSVGSPPPGGFVSTPTSDRFFVAGVYITGVGTSNGKNCGYFPAHWSCTTYYPTHANLGSANASKIVSILHYTSPFINENTIFNSSK